MNIRRLLFSYRNNNNRLIIVIAVVLAIAFSLLINNLLLPSLFYDHISAAYIKAVPTAGGPTFSDPNLKAQIIFKGLHNPTSMAFLGPNDILVLEKNTGNVIRIVNGKMLGPPLLHVNVATEVERGLLGIAIQKSANIHVPTYVFLYYTGAGSSNAPVGNHLYRYELANNSQQLVNPKLLLDLPGTPAPGGEGNHNGGKVIIGPDHNVYVVIGDVGDHRGQAQNIANGPPLDGTGGVIRVTQDGLPVANPPLGGASVGGGVAAGNMTKYYYAYGIRNSFGMAFDSVTGKLWDTENGPSYGDEINLVNPGFNSGWTKIQGIWQATGESSGAGPVAPLHPTSLVDFSGKGVYRAPEFAWQQVIAPSSLTFLNSSKLGKQYQDDMFVGDVLYGNIYDFKLDQNRTGLLLSGPLAGKVAHTTSELAGVIFGKGFGLTTDIQVGPDGYLYVLSYTGGSIYKIVPSSSLSGP
jgi:aldose sugar dehydrogenase